MENSRFYYMQNYCGFAVARNRFSGFHEYLTKYGFIAPHIGFVKSGNAELRFENIVLNAVAGDIIFIPAGVSYSSVWRGNPDIDMYVVEVDLAVLNTLDISAQLVHLPECCDLFERLYEKTANGEDMLAFADVYLLLDKILKSFEYKRKDKEQRTKAAIRFIEENYDKEFNVEELASLCGLSQSRFFSLFKEENGYSPIDYKNFIRTKYATVYIKRDEMSVEEICEKLNFSSPAYFRRILKKFTGKTPSQILKEHAM